MPAAGVPPNVPVPFPLSTNVTPDGSAPVRVMAATGNPVVVTANVPATPTVNVVALALVTAGAWLTVSVKACVLSGRTLFEAVNVIAYVPPVPAAGGPLSVPVPLPLSTNVTPAGNAVPPIAIAGAGKPDVVTVNDPAVPTMNVVAFALVIAGA